MTPTRPAANILVALIITLALLAGCGQPNATVPSESTAMIPLQIDPSRAAAAPAATSTPTTAEQDTARQTPTPDQHHSQDPGQDHGSEQGQSEDGQTEQGTSQPAADATSNVSVDRPRDQVTISERGQALGCVDASSIRRWLASTRPAVAESIGRMSDQVWLCPRTDAVSTDLTCYPDETNATLAALAELGEETRNLVDEIVASNTMFCDSGDFIRLGLDAILERAENS